VLVRETRQVTEAQLLKGYDPLHPGVWERQKKVALGHAGLRISGRLERSEHGRGAINIVAVRLDPLRLDAQPEGMRGRDFR
jgi:hypothetical protein